MLRALVHATDRRADADGEFILRLSPKAQTTLGVKTGDYVVVKAGGGKPVPGHADKSFQVLAAVRGPSQGDEPLPDTVDDSGHLTLAQVRLDVTLREAIGAKVLGEQPDRAEVTVEHSSFPVRPGFLARCLGYQFVVCRVQKAFSGDAETPLCRTSPSVIQGLGLKDRGVAVVLSPQSQVTARMLPLADSYLRHERKEVKADSPSDRIGSLMDYDNYLGNNVDFGWRVPDIHIDLDTRRMLDVVPGQPVSVRREPVALLLEKVPLIIAPIILAFFTTVIKEGKWESLLTWTPLIAGFFAALLLFALAVFEIRSSVQRPLTSRSR
jgi:hypothetical protein